jgi:general secretion pathway protein F
VKSGGRLAEALAATGSFEPLAINLVRVGEETGTLDKMVLELAAVLDRKVETGIKRGLTLLEPLLILGLGLVIAVVIVSILMGILTVNELAL